jgi:hypothetical protein
VIRLPFRWDSTASAVSSISGVLCANIDKRQCVTDVISVHVVVRTVHGPIIVTIGREIRGGLTVLNAPRDVITRVNSPVRIVVA